MHAPRTGHRPGRRTPTGTDRPLTASDAPSTHECPPSVRRAGIRVSTRQRPVSRVLSASREAGRSFLSARGHPRAPAAYPQRLGRGGRPSLPIWPCSGWGLPCHDHCWPRGGLLPHPFTLACSLGRTLGSSAVCSLLHCPSPACSRTLAPRRYLAACPVEPGLSSRPPKKRSRPSGRWRCSTSILVQSNANRCQGLVAPSRIASPAASRRPCLPRA